MGQHRTRRPHTDSRIPWRPPGVSLTLTAPGGTFFGRAAWRLPLQLLDDENFCTATAELIPAYRSTPCPPSSAAASAGSISSAKYAWQPQCGQLRWPRHASSSSEVWRQTAEQHSPSTRLTPPMRQRCCNGSRLTISYSSSMQQPHVQLQSKQGYYGRIMGSRALSGSTIWHASAERRQSSPICAQHSSMSSPQPLIAMTALSKERRHCRHTTAQLPHRASSLPRRHRQQRSTRFSPR